MKYIPDYEKKIDDVVNSFDNIFINSKDSFQIIDKRSNRLNEGYILAWRNFFLERIFNQNAKY